LAAVALVNAREATLQAENARDQVLVATAEAERAETEAENARTQASIARSEQDRANEEAQRADEEAQRADLVLTREPTTVLIEFDGSDLAEAFQQGISEVDASVPESDLVIYAAVFAHDEQTSSAFAKELESSPAFPNLSRVDSYLLGTGSPDTIQVEVFTAG
jgi:hypothetical protein